MKIFSTLLLSSISTAVFAQLVPPVDLDGLENIIVEKYYVAGANDGPDLPAGATTYRLFADLKPGWKIQLQGGFETHPLIFRAGDEQYFYNSEFGSLFGSNFLPFLLTFGTAGLDSYLAMGAATQNHYAVPKSMDTDGSILSDAEGFFQNNDPSAGISPLIADGLIPGTAPSVSELSFADFQFSPFFGTVNSPSNEFQSVNSTWFNLEQVAGVTDENIAFLGQFTTPTCEFEFELVLSLSIPLDLVIEPKRVQLYVATLTQADEALNNSAESSQYFVQRDFMKFSSDDEGLCVTSVKESQLPLAYWTLLPNPSAGEFNIRLNSDLEDVSYELYSIEGRLLKSERIGNAYNLSQISVDASNMSNGIYIVKLISGDFASSQRLILNR